MHEPQQAAPVQRTAVTAPSPAGTLAAGRAPAAPWGHDLAAVRVSAPGAPTVGEARGGLLARAFAGRLREGEVRPARVPRVDLGAGQLQRVAAAARGAADPAARPVPRGLLDGSARLAGDHVAVPGLAVRDGASPEALERAVRGAGARDAAVEVRGGRYALKLRANPWVSALTGELLVPQPGVVGGYHGEQRDIDGAGAVWHAPGLRPPRTSRAPRPHDFEEVERHEQEARAAVRAAEEQRRQAREERQQRLIDLDLAGITPDPDATWGMEQALTQAHRASRPDPTYWNHSVSSMHVPLMESGALGRPIVSQQRPMNATTEHLRRYAEENDLEEPEFLTVPQDHQHAEPTGQLQFLRQMALAILNDEELPIAALEMSSRGRCDRCEDNPEEMGLQGLIVHDDERRLYDNTPNWVQAKGFPDLPREEKSGTKRSRSQSSEKKEKTQPKRKRKKKLFIPSEHPGSKFDGPPPPPGSGGLGGEIPVF